MAQQSLITLIGFQRKFDSEQACYDHLYQMKWPEGFECPRCGHSKAYEITTLKSLYECAECGHQTTLTVGTMNDLTRTELLKWFWAIFLVAHDKRSVSATFLKRELKISYQTAWSMFHKIRQAMGECDDNYTLAGIVELDECFFGAPTEGGRRGRGTEKAKVLVELYHLKWLHTMVSNAKAMIGSTFHGLDPKHLQTYLNEFCYWFNRRNFKGQWFNRLLKCSVLT